jgi:hypothetical protein
MTLITLLITITVAVISGMILEVLFDQWNAIYQIAQDTVINAGVPTSIIRMLRRVMIGSAWVLSLLFLGSVIVSADIILKLILKN